MDVADRDRGLYLISRTTRWLVAGAVALTGVFSALAARALPGRSTHPVTVTPATASPTPTAPSVGSDAGSNADNLQPPRRAPSPANGSGSARSGAS
jgi:hypothetical protein